MAVAFDAVGPSSAGAAAAAATTLSWTHTNVASGVALTTFAAVDKNPDTGVTTTANLDPSGANTAFTSLGVRHSNDQTAGYGTLLGLANVSSGAHTVQITVSSTASIEAGSVSYSGADTSAPFSASQSAAGAVTPASVTFTGSVSGNMVTAGAVCGSAISSMTAGTSRWINNQGAGNAGGNGAQGDIASGGSVTLSWTVTSDWWAVVAAEVQVPAAAGGARSAQPGRTWLRRFHHRQTLPLPPPPAAVAAGVPVFFHPPPRNTRQLSRGHLGRMGACAAGILAVTTLSPQPTSVPPARPQPVIGHPAPHRVIWRQVASQAPLPQLTAKLPPTAVSPRPPHRALVRGVLAKTTLSPQPSSVPGPQWRQPFAPRPAHRAIWRAVSGPAPAVVAATPAAPSRPQPVTNRPPPPHRASGKGILATTTLSPQPTRVPPPQWRQPNAPRPAHRAIWRVIAGPAPAVVAVTAVPPSRPAPVTNRPPAPHRAITRRVLAAPAPLVPPSRPQPVINRPPPPHRAIVRGVLAKTTLSPQPTRVNGPQWRQPFAPRPAHRATWRRITGAAPPPPPFTIGVLTAATVPTTPQTPATAAGSRAASTAASATLTASDARQGTLTAGTAAAPDTGSTAP